MVHSEAKWSLFRHPVTNSRWALMPILKYARERQFLLFWGLLGSLLCKYRAFHLERCTVLCLWGSVLYSVVFTQYRCGAPLPSFRPGIRMVLARFSSCSNVWFPGIPIPMGPTSVHADSATSAEARPNLNEYYPFQRFAKHQYLVSGRAGRTARPVFRWAYFHAQYTCLSSFALLVFVILQLVTN